MLIDTELLQADQQARADALDVRRSFIVQAPAGSGKTELLIQRYLCLLATVSEPEEVVAITFTRKAASEMQLRVIAALTRARNNESSATAHENRTLDAARAVLQRDAQLDWRLLESPRRMRIQTLDAFCASITRLLPVSSGLGGAMQTVADAAMARLYEEAAVATLDWLAAEDPRSSAFERVLEHLDYSVPAYVSYVASMLAKRDQWLHFTGSGGIDNADEVRAALEDTLRQQVVARLRALRRQFDALGGPAERQLLRYAGDQMAATTGQEHPLQSLSARNWPAADPGSVSTWRALADLLLTNQNAIRKTVNKNTGFPPGDSGQKKAFLEWLAALPEVPGLAEQLASARNLPDAVYREDQWQVLLALFDVLPLAVADLRRLFAERGATDHVEVAQAAADALGTANEPGDLALLLDYRIRHLLVDEMQDTSDRQYKLLEQLTAGWEKDDGRTLFCVGDPMQSIYRFRDAEVGQFVAARQRGIGDVRLESLVLRQNFRSGEHLVDWFNATFRRVFPAIDDVATGAIRYSPSVPVATHAGRGAIGVYPLIDASPDDEATCSAEIIEQCLAEDDSGDVAVLVRSRAQLPLLLAELRQRGIGCRAVEIDRLTDLPEVLDLLALTRALCHPADRIAWLGLLRAPWAGLSWSDIHALVRDDRHAVVSDLLSDAERLATLTPEGRARVDALQRALQQYGTAHAARSLRERVECCWLALGGAAVLHTSEQLENAYRFLDVLEKLERAGTLPDVATLEKQLDEERVSSAGDGMTRVQVMTIHKAKGLQFEHVVLHGLGRTTGSGTRDMLAWLSVANEDGGSDIIISPLAPRAALEKDPLHRFIEQAARDSEKLELDRLLYVACTRAVTSLHLVGSVRSRAHGEELSVPPADTLLQRLWPALEEDFAREFAARQSATGPADAETPVFMAPPGSRLVTAWQAPALPPLPPLQAKPAPQAEREVDYYWVGSSARHAGTIVHRWLQKMADGEVARDALPADLEVVSRRWARNLGVPDAALDEVAERVTTALDRVLADASGRWLLDGDGHAELRLSGVHDAAIVNIVIDRVRVDGNDHWLVDYKTSSHEGGDLAGFLRQESERYQLQLRRYRDIYAGFAPASTVRTALYFPLLQKLVEVDVDGAL